MTHTALYRRLRPQTFNDIIGQEHIVNTLLNQIKSDSVSHSYLFTGTRGTGKTTSARVLAKAINCLSPVDGNPCNKCSSCVAINEGINVDIIEMDAASNNGVDYARDIRDKVVYTPTSSKFKVYIIDEVHMLSTSAFNALLKTLEEPPKHVVFILCTTEVHKLPATILSRCMRFDFRLVSVDKLFKLLEQTYKQCNRKVTSEAMNLIATCAEGSVRDCINLADRCLHYESEVLTYEDVLGIIGAISKDTLINLSQAIISRNCGEVFSIISTVLSSGRSVSILSRDLSGLFRDIIVIKSTNKANELLAYPEDILSRLTELSFNIDINRLLSFISQLATLDSSLRYSTTPRLLLEAACIKMCFYTDVVATNYANASQSSPTSTTSPADTKDYGRGKKVFATLIKQARANDMMVISLALADVSEVWVQGNKLNLVCGDTQYALLNNNDNKSELNKLIEDERLTVVLEKQPAKKDSVAEDIRTLQRIVGDNLVIK